MKKEEKIFCPRCEEAGEKREMLFLPARQDRSAQYFCYVCDYTRRHKEAAEEKRARRRIICY